MSNRIRHKALTLVNHSKAKAAKSLSHSIGRLSLHLLFILSILVLFQIFSQPYTVLKS